MKGYKSLIDHLAFVYGYVCKARGKVPQADLCEVAGGTHVIVKSAPEVIGSEDEGAEDKMDYLEALKMEEHIQEMVVYFQTLEIV